MVSRWVFRDAAGMVGVAGLSDLVGDKSRGFVMASRNVEELKKRLYEIDDGDIVAGTGGDISPAGGDVNAGTDGGNDNPILVAYFVMDYGLGEYNPRAEMWSDGEWRVTANGKDVLPEVARFLNTIFAPSRFSSARWDCVLKAADEAAKEADEELVLGDEYKPEPAEPGEGIVY